jgi:hypothetical protein
VVLEKFVFSGTRQYLQVIREFEPGLGRNSTRILLCGSM